MMVFSLWNKKSLKIFFESVTVCLYQNEYQYSSIKLKQNDKRSKYLRVTVKQPGTYYLTISIPSDRKFEKLSGYKVSISRILIAEIDMQKKTYEFVDAKQGRDSEMWFDTHLDQGIYIIQTKVFWETNLVDTYVFSSYGPDFVQIEQAAKNEIGGDEFIQQVILSRVKKYNKFEHFSHDQGILKQSQMFIEEGYGFYFMQHNGTNKLQMTTTFNKMNGLKLKKPKKFFDFEKKILKFDISKGQTYLAVFTVNFGGFSFSQSELSTY
eukprot:TRINITY_DN6531_c0_g2_i1.p1 TRINITY_DN6531_c0_g2~~TRINITY_DN6531_c0_g2_i1.p1  ORF type:complete len:266 (+),score=37.09 TRINITY_DN6531_c0_g2_i1:229-1026(+)